MPPEKIEHLKLIQGVIQRLGQNSFAIKGWCVTIVSALIALGAKDASPRVIAVGFLPTFLFWCLDGFYLWRERRFRELYSRIARGDDLPPFTMHTNDEVHVKLQRSLFSLSLLAFYLCLLGVALVAMILLARGADVGAATSKP